MQQGQSASFPKEIIHKWRKQYNDGKGDDMDENELLQEINESLKAIKKSVSTISSLMVLIFILGLLVGACSVLV